MLECEFRGMLIALMSQHFAKPCLAGNWFRHLLLKPSSINPPATILAIVCLLILQLGAFAQLPTPSYGWNLGNTLEPPCGEGCWGPPATQALINAVTNAGFNTIRIPCAWDSHANQSTYQIDPAYMARVKQVVDWCIADEPVRHYQRPLGWWLA